MDGITAEILKNFNGALSEEISINNGIKQGDISTFMLFNIYLAIVFLVAFYGNFRRYLHKISDIWQCFLMSVGLLSLKKKSLLHR